MQEVSAIKSKFNLKTKRRKHNFSTLLDLFQKQNNDISSFIVQDKKQEEVQQPKQTEIPNESNEVSEIKPKKNYAKTKAQKINKITKKNAISQEVSKNISMDQEEKAKEDASPIKKEEPVKQQVKEEEKLPTINSQSKFLNFSQFQIIKKPPQQIKQVKTKEEPKEVKNLEQVEKEQTAEDSQQEIIQSDNRKISQFIIRPSVLSLLQKSIIEQYENEKKKKKEDQTTLKSKKNRHAVSFDLSYEKQNMSKANKSDFIEQLNKVDKIVKKCSTQRDNLQKIKRRAQFKIKKYQKNIGNQKERLQVVKRKVLGIIKDSKGNVTTKLVDKVIKDDRKMKQIDK